MILRLTAVEHLLHRLHILPTPVMDTFSGVLFGRALSIAVRNGFFEVLSTQPQSCEQIAGSLSFDLGAVRILADMFVVAGYLRCDGERYALSREGKKWLVKSSPSYIGNLVRYFESLYNRWGYLEQTLRHGQPPRPYYDVFTAEDWQAYVFGMRDLARLLIPEVLRHLDLGRQPRQLLDVGGSHGLYALTCCQLHPSLQATIMDFEPTLHYTSALLAGEEARSRMQLVGGDFTKASFPQEQDAIFMFNIIHGFSVKENEALVERALDALRPHGKLYILDQLKEQRKRSGLARFMPLIVGLHLMNEVGGTTYEFGQVRSWCMRATSVRRIHLRLPGVTIVEVVK